MNLSEATVLEFPHPFERSTHERSAMALDQLPDRQSFLQRLDRELTQATGPTHTARIALSVICLNLDIPQPGFGRFTQDIRESLVRIVVARLVHGARISDLFGHMGPDEFACMMIDIPDGRFLRRWAHRCHDAASTPVRIERIELHVQPSIGTAIYPTDGTCAAVLLANALCAMNTAKRNRTGFGFYGPEAAS
jgi:diguanylate cyclase